MRTLFGLKGPETVPRRTTFGLLEGASLRCQKALCLDGGHQTRTTEPNHLSRSVCVSFESGA